MAITFFCFEHKIIIDGEVDLKKLKPVAVAEIGKQAGGIAFWKMEN